MLLFGLNKKLFAKEYRVEDFVKSVKEWVEKEGKSQGLYHIEVERSGYLILYLEDSIKKNKSNEFQVIEMVDEKKGRQKKEEVKNEHRDFMEIKKEKFKGNFKISSDEIEFGKIKIKIVPVEESEESRKLYQNYCESIHAKPEKSSNKSLTLREK